MSARATVNVPQGVADFLETWQHSMELAGAWPLERRCSTYDTRAIIRRRLEERDTIRRHGRPVTHHAG